MLSENILCEYTYNGCKPDVKVAIAQWSVEGVGIRAIVRKLQISTDTVIAELKKRSSPKLREQGILQAAQTRQNQGRNE